MTPQAEALYKILQLVSQDKVDVPDVMLAASEAVLWERRDCQNLVKDAIRLAHSFIVNRGCTCNEAEHRCGTNQMLEDLDKIKARLR